MEGSVMLTINAATSLTSTDANGDVGGALKRTRKTGRNEA